MGVTENTRTHHDHVGPGFYDLGDVGAADAAVDFKFAGGIVRFDQVARLAQFLERVRDERLPAETGIHAHDQNQVDIFDHVLQQPDRSRGVERNAGLRAEAPNLHEQPLQMRGRFPVHRDHVAAGFAEILDVTFGFRDHQMRIEGAPGEPAEILDDLRAPGDIGHERAVHHVEVHVVGACRIDQSDLLRDGGEIGGE
jgi:hypothetical protein